MVVLELAVQTVSTPSKVRAPASTSSDFVLPGTINPLPFFLMGR